MHHDVTYYHCIDISVGQGVLSFIGRKGSHEAASIKRNIPITSMEEWDQGACPQHEEPERINLVVTFLTDDEDDMLN